jgi:hypothetical protein
MNSNESPWVFFFSKFSSEALLFEALVIFTLLAIYAAFFVLRKRRFGSVKTQIPAGVVKAYLNELIGDAESLRAQLFGLLYSAGVPAAELAHLRNGIGAGNTTGAGAGAGISAGAMLQATQAGGGDPAAVQALEAKLAVQAKQIETFLADKARVEKELEDAKNKGDSGGGSNQNDLNKLQEKIGLLEGKLAEYSVIEDDLANLKRLQQENTQLKAQLGGKPAEGGVSGPAPVAAGPNTTSAPTAAAAAPGVSASQKDAAESSLDDALASLTTDAAAAAPAPHAAASNNVVQGTTPEKSAHSELQTDSSGSTPLEGADFEGLVDNVEKSLEKSAEEAAAAAPPSTTEVPSATIEKSDADLVAEFEKMLKG